MTKKILLLRLEMQLMMEAENVAMARTIAGLRRCSVSRCHRHRLTAEQSYEESSNKKASFSSSSASDARQRRDETYGVMQPVNGEVSCWCPPGFCRCQIKTPVHDPNRDLMMLMFPCKCPPGFVCRCIRIQHNDEDTYSCDESVGSCSPNSLPDQCDQWKQSNEKILCTNGGAKVVDDVGGCWNQYVSFLRNSSDCY